MNDNPPKKPRERRLLGCLIKGPFGCLAFLIGAFIVFVLFLPPTLGRAVSSMTEEFFAERHMGTLELSDAWLGSLYSEQRIESFVLRDPDGMEVLYGTAKAPTFETLFEEEPHWGPIEVDVARVTITTGPDGRTNLARALEARDPESRKRAKIDLGTVAMNVTIDRLTWVGASGRELAVSGVRLQLSWVDEGNTLRIEGSGMGYFGLQSGEEEERFGVGCQLGGIGGGAHDPEVWRLSVSGEKAPLAIVSLLPGLTDHEGLVSEFGDELGPFRLEVSRLPDGSLTRSLVVDGYGVELESF